MATSHFLQKNFNSSALWSFIWQKAGLFRTFSKSCSWKSWRAITRCSLLARIMLCPVIHALHQNAQHWKQYKLWELVLSQFPHFTPLLSCSLMATTSSRFTRRKLVGSSLRSPLLGRLISVLHSGSGHVKVSGRPLDRRTCSKQFRQKLCKHGSILGSVLRAWHFEQETSLRRFWRLCVKSSVSMTVAARQLAIDQLSTGRQNITAAESALILKKKKPVTVSVSCFTGFLGIRNLSITTALDRTLHNCLKILLKAILRYSKLVNKQLNEKKHFPIPVQIRNYQLFSKVKTWDVLQAVKTCLKIETDRKVSIDIRSLSWNSFFTPELFETFELPSWVFTRRKEGI